MGEEGWLTETVFMVKTDKAVHYISSPYRKGWLNAIRSFFINIPIKDTQGKEIEVAPWPTCVKRVRKRDIEGYHDDPSTSPNEEVDIIEFTDNGSLESERLKTRPPVVPDTVIFATGYNRDFPFLASSYPTPEDCTVRGIYRDIADGFGYIGMVRPSIGAIPPLAELQSQLFISRLITHHFPLSSSPSPSLLYPNSIPPYDLDYTLHPHSTHDHTYDHFRTKLGVEQESYAYQLALDMGAAPTASHVLREHGWKVFYTWAMGPNFNTKFRLVGPWAAPGEAAGVMRGELWGVVRRSGGGVCEFLSSWMLVVGGRRGELLTMRSSFRDVYDHPAGVVWSGELGSHGLGMVEGVGWVLDIA